MFWEILGIEPTKNKTEITNAYRTKLMETNPEDKPEEFKQLRQAYEEALNYADFNEDNLSKIDQMIAKLDEIYKDMHKRSSLDEWKNLLSEDVFTDLNSREKAMEEMFGYFLDNYRLPHDVMIYLNEEFDLLNRVDELKEKLPPEFVDYIIVDGITYEEPLLYKMFTPGENYEECEEYLKIFLQIRNLSYAESKPLFEQMRNMNESHPTAEGFMLACEVVEGYPEKLEDLKKLCEDTGYYHRIAQFLVDTYIALERYEEAVEAAVKGLENDPDDNGLRLKYSDALAGTGKYNEAIDQLHDLMNKAGGDDGYMDMLGERRTKHNLGIIEDLGSKNPDELTDEQRQTLAWAYIQNENYDAAKAVYEKINKENIESFSYNNMSSALAEHDHNYMEAVSYIDLLIEEIRNLKDDGTEKTAKRMKRVPEMISRKAYIYYEMGQMEECIKLLEDAVNEDPYDGNILTQIVKVLYLDKQYDKAAQYAQRLVEINPKGYHGFLLLAKSLFRMYRDREAYEYINRALDINGSDLDSYMVKLKLLIRNNAEEASRDIVKFLEDNGVNDFIELDFCKAMIVETYDKDSAKACELYKQITEKIDNGVFMEDPAHVYYRYVVSANDSLDGNKKEDRDIMFDIVNRGLKHDPESRSLLDYRAWLLRKDGQNKESLEIYLKLAENPNHGSNTDYQIGDIYFDDLDENADKSYEYFKVAYDKGDRDALYYLVYTLYYMDRLDESEKYCYIYRDYLKERGIVDIDSYYRMSFIEEKRKNYEKALEENEVALKHAIERNVKIYYYLNHKVRLLRFMNRFDEAAEVLVSNKDIYDEKYYYETLYKVYIQAGMYKKAMDVIDEWAKNKNVGDSHYPFKVELYLLMNEYRKAKVFKDKNFLKMKKDDIRQADQYLNEYDNNYAAQIKYYQDKIKNSKDPSNFNLIQLAVTYKEAGIEKNAVEQAKLALDHFVKTAPKFSQYKALDHIFLAKIYICLNEFDTAKKHIDMARVSTCAHCTYCACKDADQYEIFMYIEMGEYDKALELLESKTGLWTDDMSFGEYVRLIAKRKRN